MVFSDEIAQALWTARASAGALEGPLDPDGLSRERAEAIAAELYDALAYPCEPLGWKLGATDPQTQRRLGSTEPFVAPIYAATELELGASISLSRLSAPRLEGEIGFEFADGELVPVPCVEIADCRISNWQVSIEEAIADFGLQGALLFDRPSTRLAAGDDVVVRVAHNGTEVACGRRSVAEARRLAGFAWPRARGLRPRRWRIASGTVTPPLPLDIGEWRVDFGPLGRIELCVER